MNIEEKIQIEANKLLSAYYPFYFKRYPRRLSQLKEKFFSYFIKIASMFCIRNDYDSDKFIEASLMDGFKFPQQLCNEQAWKTYLNYLPCLHDKKDEEVLVVEGIVNAAITIKRVGGFSNWLKSPINQQMVIEENMPFEDLLPSFSKSFIDFCNEECGDNYDFETTRKYVLSFKNSDKILNKIKEVLGNDYYLFDEELEDNLEKANFIF